MSTDKKNIPVHHTEPHFVDSESQPVITYYIWNIDGQEFKRKRKTLPKNLPKDKKEKYVKETLKIIKDALKNGMFEFNDQKRAKNLKPITEDTGKKIITIQEAFDEFISHKTISLSSDSIKAYKGYINHFAEFCNNIGIYQKPINELTLQTMSEFYESMWSNKKLAAKTHNEIISLINSVIKRYIKKEYIAQDITITSELKIVESEEGHHPLTLEQIASMKNEILINQNDEQWWLFFNFCFYTAARPRKEIRLLKVKDISEHTILISSDRAKNNNSRRIIIPEALEELITKHNIRAFDKEFYVFSAKGVPGPTPTGKNYFYKRNVKTLKNCGFTEKDYDLYSSKHTGNIHAYVEGTDIYDLMKHNGHKSISQTERYLRKIGAIRKEDKDSLKHPKI